MIIYELPDGKICLFGQGKGLEPDVPGARRIRQSKRRRRHLRAAGGCERAPAAAAGRVRRTDLSLLFDRRQELQLGHEEGKGIGLWTERCKFDTGLWDVIYDEAKDLFALRVDAGEPYPVLRQFRKAGGAQALLADLKSSGLVLDDAECVMAQVADLPAPGWTAWQVVPTGKRKEAFDSIVQVEVPEPPCGEIGYRVDLVGFFMVNDAKPDRVLYVNLGQDGTMIDINSITLGD